MGGLWMWRSVLCVSLVCGLALDSNTIRSSREQHSPELPVERPVRRRTDTNVNSPRGETPPCSTPDCHEPQRGGCSNRAQRRSSPRVDTEADRQSDMDGFNRTKAPEMAGCVRSGDCAAGLCCARYLTGRRCQRIPAEGEACLLRGSGKLRRKLDRCDCEAGLSCRAEPGGAKGHGACVPRQRQGQRSTRHSGKKRRTAERSC